MSDSTAVPSRHFRLYAQAAKWLFWLLVAAWTLFALAAAALHGFIVPRIDQFRPTLEQRAGKALGVPVSIGRISARSTGLFPTIELQDVTLGPADQDNALHLARVVATVSPRSIWRVGFEHLLLDHLHLELRRDADGKLHVGGLKLSDTDSQSGDSAAADWLFSQPEVLVEGATLRLVDEMAEAPPIALEDVRLALTNKGLRHELRIDATPPLEWGQRISLQATMRQPLLTLHSGRWREWSGQLYADVPALDLTRLNPWLKAGANVDRGNAALRLWAEVKQAQPLDVTADAAFTDVRATLSKDAPALESPSAAGRIRWSRVDDGFDLSAQGLRIETAIGAAWPGRELRLKHRNADPQRPERGELAADGIDLALLDQWLQSVPLDGDGARARESFSRLAPKGLVAALELEWLGAPDALQKYRGKGRISGLELTAQAAQLPKGAPRRRVEPGQPGLAGASADFDFDQAGGKATIAIDHGSLTFPGVFEEPTIPIDKASGALAWQSGGGQWRVTVSELEFANADAAGRAEAKWRTSEPAESARQSRFPGVLELSGNLVRANGTRVHRYLPLELSPDVRHYVRDAIQAGSASNVAFRVRGDLYHLPFTDPKAGEFRIAANVRDVTYAFVPPAAKPGNEPPWPPLTQLSGELVFDRASMRVNGAQGQYGSAPGLPVKNANVVIANLDRSVVQVDAETSAPLSEMLESVNTSPVGAMTGHVLARASGSGEAALKLKLSLPIANLDKSKVQGSVVLTGNDLRFDADGPLLQHASGSVAFSEKGFSVDGATARIFGGQARIDGGSTTAGGGNGGDPVLAEFRASGSVSAEGLRAAPELGAVARLSRDLSGSARYEATLRALHAGAELVVQSDLQGLASSLPAPLAKPAEAALSLRYATVPLAAAQGGKAQDRLSLSLGEVVSASYLRDLSGPLARALSGSLTLGLPTSAAPAAPTGGVAAKFDLARFDVDAWMALAAPPDAATAGAGEADRADSTAMRSYWPTQWQGRIGTLDVDGYRLQNVVLNGSREKAQWNAQVETDELSGRLEYSEAENAGPGRISARLARLVLPDPTPAAATLAPQKPTEQLPALDIVIDDFQLRGRKLGRVEVDAVNRRIGGGGAREWRLNKLDVTNPDAHLAANGSWSQVGSGSDPNALNTTMDFVLEIADSGALLARFGMKDVIRRGRGVMQGRLNWDGSPLALDFPSLGGRFHLTVESGQFLKADPGLAKLLGVLSLQALPRRLTLDFRDIFSQGFAFDFIRGDVAVSHGVAATNNLQMKGASAAVLMDGSADIARETQNLKVVVVPEIDAGTAALVATVINPAIGLGTFLAQYFLSKPLSEAATQEFRIEGTWSDPKITKIPRAANPDASGRSPAAISFGATP